MSEPHFVEVPCSCEHDDPERCVMTRYVSDVRTAIAELRWAEFERDCLAGYIESLQGQGTRVEDQAA